MRKGSFNNFKERKKKQVVTVTIFGGLNTMKKTFELQIINSKWNEENIFVATIKRERKPIELIS